MSLSCAKLIRDIKLIKNLRTELTEQEEEFLLFRNTKEADRSVKVEKLSKLFKVRSGLTSLIKEIKNGLIDYSFVVEDAINPYTDTMQASGSTDRDLLVERKDITVDLQKILDQDRKAYKAAGLAWINFLPEKIENFNLKKEHIEIIKARVKLGEIPIAMPGRLGQLWGLKQAIEKLRPKFLKDGKLQESNQTFCRDYIADLVDVMADIAEAISHGRRLADDEKWFKIKKALSRIVKGDSTMVLHELYSVILSIPEQPYIFTASARQTNEERARNKTIFDQAIELNDIRAENKGLNVNSLSFGEYLALQNRATERMSELAGTSLDELRPLDNYQSSMTATATRFIDMPVSLNNAIPVASWDIGGSMIIFNSNASELNKGMGFRYSVRVASSNKVQKIVTN